MTHIWKACLYYEVDHTAIHATHIHIVEFTGIIVTSY